LKRIINVNRTYYALLPLIYNKSVLREGKIKIYKTLIRPVATNGAESWTLHKDIDKRLAAFERKVLIRMFWGVKVNANWRKRYNKEIIPLFGDLHII